MGVRGKFEVLALVALLSGAASPARVEEAAAGPGGPDYTEFDLGQLTDMDVVYGASSYDQKLTDAPASVTVITAEEIRSHGYLTLADVLASVRGFHVTYDRSYSYVGVRGFGRPGDYNTRVLILHDGHPANDIIYGTAPVGAEMAVDLSMVRRIEVIRGPGSALYGAGAFFAVVNLVTWDGSELEGGEVLAAYGTRRERGGHAFWGGSVGGGSLALAAQGRATDGDDIHWAEFDDPSTNGGLFEDGDGEQAGHLFGKYRLGGLQATAAWARRTKHIPTAEWGMIFNDDGAWVSDERLALDLSLEHGFCSASTLRVRLGYDDYLCRGEYPYDDADEGQPLLRQVQHDEAHGRWWSGEARLSGRVGAHRLVMGADFSHAVKAGQSSALVDPPAAILEADRDLGNEGIHLQDEWDLGPGASLYAGLRYDRFRSFGGHLTPRCGVIAHVGASTTAKLLYGEAFRAPNAYEMYYEDGISQKANPDLEPERIRTWELVVERDLADVVGADVRAGLSLFDNAIEEIIEQEVDQDDGLLAFRNLGDVRTWGAEFDLDARLLAGLRGRLSVSGQRTEDRATGSPLTNAPARLVKLNLSTPRQGAALAAAVEFQHVSRRSTGGGSHVPSYAVVNANLTWWAPVRGLQLDVSVLNALDQRYADPGAGHQAQDALAREGRLARASLGWRW